MVGSLSESSMPLHERISVGSINPDIRRAATDIGHRTEASQLARKRGHRKQTSTHEQKNYQQRRIRKSASEKISQRAQTDRRFLDFVNRRRQRRRRTTRSTFNLFLLTQPPGQSIFPVNSAPTVKSELSTRQIFEDYLTQSFAGSPTQQHPIPKQVRLKFDNISPALQQQSQHHYQQQQHVSYHQHPASEPNTGNVAPHADFDFSNQTTPYHSDIFDGSLLQGIVDPHIHIQFQQAPFSALPFSMPGNEAVQGGFPGRF